MQGKRKRSESASSEEAIYGLCVICLFMALRGMLGIVWHFEIAWRLLNSCILVEFWKFLCLFFKALKDVCLCEGTRGSFLGVGVL